MQSFARTLPVAFAIYCLLRVFFLDERMQIADTLAWIHAKLENEQKVKLLYILEMGWLNLAEHDI